MWAAVTHAASTEARLQACCYVTLRSEHLQALHHVAHRAHSGCLPVPLYGTCTEHRHTDRRSSDCIAHARTYITGGKLRKTAEPSESSPLMLFSNAVPSNDVTKHTVRCRYAMPLLVWPDSVNP
jgi:hypothetical protein